MLFGAYRDKAMKRLRLSEPLPFLCEQQIRTEWMKLIHGALYEKVSPNTREKRIRRHSYIPAFLDIIKKAPMTVNYNFDDTLEKLLMFSRTEDEKVTTRGYESPTSPIPSSRMKAESFITQTDFCHLFLKTEKSGSDLF